MNPLSCRAAVFMVSVLPVLQAPAAAFDATHGQVLVDVSGSMDRNDRQRLRWDGILTYTRLLALSPENMLTVRYFSAVDEVKIPHTGVAPDSLESFERLAREKPADSGKTDIVPSLSLAVGDLETREGRRYVLVVSDGVFAGDRQIVWLARKLKRLQASLFFVCIAPGGLGGRSVNRTFVESCRMTGGEAYSVESSREVDHQRILEIFLDIFARIATPSLMTLTGGDGAFAVHRSHRSFIVLTPDGRDFQLVSPTGEVVGDQDSPFRARGIRFHRWHLVACERPRRELVRRVWQSDAWRVVDRRTRRPLENAHVYVHSDVGFDGVHQRGFTVREGTPPGFDFGILADALGDWVPPEDQKAILDGLKVEVEISEGRDAFDVLVGSGELEVTGNGKVTGTIPVHLKAGRYKAAFTVRHEELSGAAVLRKIDIPLVVVPSYVDQKVVVKRGGGEVVRSGGDAGADAGRPAAYAGDHIMYEVSIDLNALTPRKDSVESTLSMRRVALDLLLPDGTSGGTFEMRQVASRGGRLVYRSDWIVLEEAGTYQGQFDLEGSVRISEASVLRPGGSRDLRDRVVRQEKFEDRIAAREVRCGKPTFRIEWEPMPSMVGSDEAVRFSGRMLPDNGREEDLERLARDAARGGLRFEVVRGEERWDSTETPEAFREVRADLSDGIVEFSGVFVGPKARGEYSLRAYARFPEERAVLRGGTDLRLAVGGNLLDVRMSAERGGRRLQVVPGDRERGTAATVFADDQVLLEVRPTGEFRTRWSGGFDAPPIIEIVSIGERRELPVEGSGDYYHTRLFAPRIGEHVARVEADCGDSLVTQEFPIVVLEHPEPQLSWEAPLAPEYLQFESASLGIKISFDAGTPKDWEGWLRECRVVATTVGSALETDRSSAELVRDRTQPKEWIYRLGMPTRSTGTCEVAVQVFRKEQPVSGRLRAQWRVVPLVDLQVTQGDSPLARAGEVKAHAGVDYRRVEVRAGVRLGDRGKVVSSHVRVRKLPAKGKEGEGAGEARVQWTLDLKADKTGLFSAGRELPPGEYVFRVEADVAVRPGDRTARLVWESPAIRIADASRWPQILGAGVPGLALGLVLFVVFLFRRDPPLPLLQGRITWFHPEYETRDFTITSGFGSRLLAFGKRERKLCISRNGPFSFGVPPEDVGLSRDAQIGVEITGPRSASEDGSAFLEVRGRNVGAQRAIVVSGHMRGRIMGEKTLRMRLDQLSSVSLRFQSGPMCILLQLDVVGEEIRRIRSQRQQSQDPSEGK